MNAWTVLVSRDDITRTEVVPREAPSIGEGEVLLRVDRVGLTANNATYAVYGDVIGYWNFFPAPRGRGIVPVWGFADVVESAVDDYRPGDRIYGLLPMASHLVVRPSVDAGGFVDVAEHRTPLPGVYNRYVPTTADPAYSAGDEDLQLLYRPLFYTSFLLADQVVDNDCYGARTVVISSASSKTAFGTALLLREHDVRVVGLTSPANVDFATRLACYDTVLPYGRPLDLESAVYLDFTGSPELRAALHERLGSALVKDIAIGLTNQKAAPDPRAEFFFAPDRLRQRVADWGHAGLAKRFGEAWRELTTSAARRVQVVRHSGPHALTEVWQEVVAGKTRPDQAHVLTF